MKIFINPGHCPGVDSGAVSPNTGLQEADVALNIGNKVAEYLQCVGYEVQVFQSDSLSEICDSANNWSADLFVSIHCNAANMVAQGTETLIFSLGGNAEKLAQCIQNQIVNSLYTIDRGLKIRPGLYVLKHTACPAVLAETAFIDNDDDAALLVDRQDEFAAAIARGITDYVGAV